jgi:hypothetical protein
VQGDHPLVQEDRHQEPEARHLGPEAHHQGREGHRELEGHRQALEDHLQEVHQVSLPLPPHSVAIAPFEKRASYIYSLSGFRGELRPRREIVLKEFYKTSYDCNLPLGGMTCNLESRTKKSRERGSSDGDVYELICRFSILARKIPYLNLIYTLFIAITNRLVLSGGPRGPPPGARGPPPGARGPPPGGAPGKRHSSHFCNSIQ